MSPFGHGYIECSPCSNDVFLVVYRASRDPTQLSDRRIWHQLLPCFLRKWIRDVISKILGLDLQRLKSFVDFEDWSLTFHNFSWCGVKESLTVSFSLANGGKLSSPTAVGSDCRLNFMMPLQASKADESEPKDSFLVVIRRCSSSAPGEIIQNDREVIGVAEAFIFSLNYLNLDIFCSLIWKVLWMRFRFKKNPWESSLTTDEDSRKSMSTSWSVLVPFTANSSRPSCGLWLLVAPGREEVPGASTQWGLVPSNIKILSVGKPIKVEVYVGKLKDSGKIVKSCNIHQNPMSVTREPQHFFMQRCYPSERNRPSRSGGWCIALPNMNSFLKEMHKCHNCGAIENTSIKTVSSDYSMERTPSLVVVINLCKSWSNHRPTHGSTTSSRSPQKHTCSGSILETLRKAKKKKE